MRTEQFYKIQDFYIKTEGEWPERLEVREVSKSNYPHNVERAISGFEDFDEAKEFALKHNLETVVISRKFGQDYWRFKHFADGPIELDCDWFRDDDKLYSMFDASVLEEDIENAINDRRLPTIMAENYRNKFTEAFDYIDELKEDELLLIHHFNPEYLDILKKTTMSMDKDSTSYLIAVI